MKGDSSGFSLQDFLLLVGMQFRTGELILESGNNIGSILLHKGDILHASSPYSRAIGDLLVEDGLISEAELLETLVLQKKSSYAPLGGQFRRNGKVTIEIIEKMVHEQIRQSLKEFQTWKDISASFVDKDIQRYDRIHLPAREFIFAETLQAASNFLSGEVPSYTPPLEPTSTHP